MSQIDRRQMLKLMAALGATGLAAGCGAGDDEDAQGGPAGGGQTLKIGLIAPQTGGYKPIGDEMVNGFQLYLDFHENRLGGHPIDLVVADEGDTPQSGKAALDRLIGQGVVAVSGIASSAVMLAVRKTIEEAKVPLIGSNASPRNLQGVVYIWRTSYVNDEPGLALGQFLRRQLGRNARVAMIAPDYEAGRDALQGFRSGFGPDPRLSSPIWTPFSPSPKRRAYREAVQQLLAQDPQAIFCFFAGDAAVEFIRELREAGYRGSIYASGFLTEGTVLDELGDQARGIRTALNYSADLDNAANARFTTGYRKKHGASPTTYAMASYDAALVLDRAIRLAGERPTPQQINLALGKIGQIDSPRGPWQFNQSRTPQQKWYLREVRRDGQVLGNMIINELATLG